MYQLSVERAIELSSEIILNGIKVIGHYKMATFIVMKLEDKGHVLLDNKRDLFIDDEGQSKMTAYESYVPLKTSEVDICFKAKGEPLSVTVAEKRAKALIQSKNDIVRCQRERITETV